MEVFLILRNHTMNVHTPSFLHSYFRVTWAPAVHHVSKSAREVFGYKYYNNLLAIRGTRPIHLPQDRVMAPVHDAAELRSDFIKLLRSRRSEEVPLSVEPAKPVKDPLYQGGPPCTEAMESCPREKIADFEDRLEEENFYLITEAGQQGRLPVIILKMKERKQKRRPAVVILHSSYKTKEWLRPLLEAYASRGYIAVAIDSRYHGERASNKTTYRDALVSAWKNGDTMPFVFDTSCDAGMHAWFGAAVDDRYAVVAPIIGVQGFRWAIDNDKWQARANSIKPVFEEARIEFGKSSIDKDVVEKVWDRIAPGLASQFDSPYTIPIIAPRPLLIVNGAEDPRCPIAGLEIPVSRAIEAYREADCPEKFKFITQPGIGHEMTPLMVKEASDWFDKFLK